MPVMLLPAVTNSTVYRCCCRPLLPLLLLPFVRGRGGRGGASSNLGGGSFKTNAEFTQLQTAAYYIGGSPKKFNALQDKRDLFNRTLAPPVRDQGVVCSTCVGQAIASAIQLSLANTLEFWKTRLPPDYNNFVKVTKEGGVENVVYDVDAITLYYCAAGGRSCQTGWDIPTALEDVLKDSAADDHFKANLQGKWMRPAKCLDLGYRSRNFNNDIEEAENAIWDPVCRDAAKIREADEEAPSKQNVTALQECFDITEKPLYTCDYVSLSSFWQIQRWIRLYGSVITRIQIQDDFQYFLNETARKYTGDEWRIYDQNVTAKFAFGHAALIVGYDNDNYTWTILNSWGTTYSTDRTRTYGVTKDGTFRVRMGLLGIGTPDATYGVQCSPREGSKMDPDFTKGWVKDAKDAINMRPNGKFSESPGSEGCPMVESSFSDKLYNNDLTAFVDFKGLVDFSPRIIPFVHNNYQILGYNVAEFSWKFPYRMTRKQMLQVWQVVAESTSYVAFLESQGNNKITPKREPRFYPHTHYFECYESGGETPFHCPPDFNKSGVLNGDNQPTFTPQLTDFALCAQNSSHSCTLRYWDVNVTGEVTPGLVLVHPLCGAPLSYVSDCVFFDGIDCTANGPPPPDAAESSAMKNIMDGLDPNWPQGSDTTGGTNRSAGTQGSKVNPADWIFCPARGGRINRTMTINKKVITWRVTCTVARNDPAAVPRVTSLFFRVDADTFEEQPELTPDMQAAISNLRQLTTLDIRVFGGDFTTTLNVLDELRTLKIYHICTQSSLPDLWFTSWRSLEVLVITKDAAAYSYAPGRTRPQDECGVQGAIPDALRDYSNMTDLDLSHNRFSGPLPSSLINRWTKLRRVQLQENQLTGPIPADWADFSPTRRVAFDFRDNQFEFDFPQSWSAFQGKLSSLRLDNNAGLTGCVPISDRTTFISTAGTDMVTTNSGRCSFAPSKQRSALNQYLNNVLGATSRRSNAGSARQADSINTMLDQLKAEMSNLGRLVPAGQSSTKVSRNAGDNSNAFAELEVTRMGGDNAEFITAVVARNAALDLTDLPKLIAGLPELRSFECQSCNRSAAGSQRNMAVLSALPKKATNLTTFSLPGCKLTGQLPSTWCNWTSLTSLDLGRNELAGKLPAEYGNPSLSACRPFLSRRLVLNLTENSGLAGRVPPSYSWFSAANAIQLDVRGSKVGGCCPDGLLMLPELPYCFQWGNATSSSVLKALKEVLTSNSGQAALLSNWTIDNAVNPNQQDETYGPYLYCTWPGITCRAPAYPGAPADGVITGLNLTSLCISYPSSGPALSAIIGAISTLDSLESLTLSKMQLAGTIPAALAGFETLQQLDLSGNTGLIGTLPELLGGLTSLVSFDISSCSGISGSLPALYAAMASLESFDASNCGQLDSSIPPSWVLLKNLRSLKISNSKVNGSLPDWVDVAYLRTAGLAVARAADKTARRSAGAAADPSERKAIAKAAKRAAASMSAATAGDVKGWSKLEVLLLPNNRLEGTVPLSYSNLVNLTALDLSGNGLLLGPLPSLGKLELLQLLNLAGNAFTGVLPPSYNQLTELKEMDLSNNNITGTLPGEYVSLKGLQTLNVSVNNITGTVPTIWQAFGGLTYQLRCLVLHSNPLLDKTFPGTTKNSLKVVKEIGDTC
uniref:Uncharacterized protein n=1 Tax=Tetradesmus obliquus TaxID=3088 RepID=A0A383VQN6_TETOB|eukprot:jgi/Sobl393_1/17052/SZX67159.1